MHAPYTDHAVDAFQAAEYAAGAALTCLALGLLPKRWPLRVSYLAGLWAAVLGPAFCALAPGFGLVGDTRVLHDGLLLARVLLLVALVLRGRIGPLVFGIVATGGVWFLDGWLQDSEHELCALHVALAGLVLGLVAELGPRAMVTTTANERPRPGRLELAQDAGVFCVSMLLAALVAHFVLFRGTDSSDEWAYTYQAAVFAKGKLYGKMPPCFESCRMYWVFWREERLFAQYQPGWPLFLAPFVLVGQAWLGGPAALGVLGVALARLGRLAVGSFGGATPTEMRRGGLVAAAVAVPSNLLLINGASRYAHVLTAALFALTVEAALRVGRARLLREAVRGGLWLGFVAGWSLVVRAPDAVLLSSGVAVYLLVATVRRRMHVAALGAALLTCAAWVLFLFYSAKVQVGEWGVLPYQIGGEFHSWVHMAFSVPSRSMWKWSFPLMWGAYEWFPLVPGVGIAGFALALRAGKDLRRVVFVLAVPSLALLGFYAMLEWGRGNDFGYGPRYQLSLVVPMAIGAALALHAALRRVPVVVRSLLGAGFAAVCSVGVVVVGSYLYPYDRKVLADVMGVEVAARDKKLQNAIVVVPNGVSPHGAWDITRNLPIELYDSPVLYVNDAKVACLREAFPARRIYKAEGRGNVRLTPLDPASPNP